MWACAVWACVCSRGLVLIRLEDCQSRRIYVHVPMFLRRPVVSCNYRPKLNLRGVLLPAMFSTEINGFSQTVVSV